MDNDLALKIYIKARATPKVVAAFAERREFDKILIYSKQVPVYLSKNIEVWFIGYLNSIIACGDFYLPCIIGITYIFFSFYCKLLKIFITYLL